MTLFELKRYLTRLPDLFDEYEVAVTFPTVDFKGQEQEVAKYVEDTSVDKKQQIVILHAD